MKVAEAVSGVLCAAKVPTLENIRALERAMLEREDQVELPVTHHFCKGMYARWLEIPKGSAIVGKMHAQENFFLLLKGEMTVWTTNGMRRVKAPFMCVTKPGDKRVGYAHEDSVTINFHPNPDDEQDLLLLEDRYIVDEQELLAREIQELLGAVK